MKANLTENRENFFEKANKKSNTGSNQLLLLVSFILIISLMIFIPNNFIGKNEKKIMLFKNSSYQSFKNLNIIGENEEKNNCIYYDKETKNCLECSLGYKLSEGECIINFSFKAIYVTKKRNENINLINNLPNDIIEMIIDGKKSNL